MKWEPLIWKKIERGKDAGVLAGNGVYFKLTTQYGQKKGKSDLRTH